MTSAAAATPAPAPRHKRHLWLKIGLPLILVPIAVVALWVWVTLGFTYSNGQRTGYVQKLSNKGWICKTWEGQLAMSPVPGSMPQMFNFTIRSDSLARALEAAAGKMVTLEYAQHVGVPGNCFGDTEYYVESFRIAGGK